MSNTNRTAVVGRPTLRKLDGGKSISTWRREAEAMRDVADQVSAIADTLPTDSETREDLGTIAADYRLFAAMRGVTRDDSIEACRDEADREMYRGAKRALACIHPDDAKMREWHTERVRECRAIAGLPVVELVAS